ncbi:hypothetical protein RRG08_040548 [Elysia crispata]|uniref:Multiple epidermal growth factor-like domains 10 n=1 Tax=Elysia crispata TaxID=231223 RepID=A0AAE1DM73_9GAST|nr:hypothetical protein RRG08_040548 [Elysia crispata]
MEYANMSCSVSQQDEAFNEGIYPGITRASYTVVPNYKIDFAVRKVLINVNPLGNNLILTLCEVFVFGECSVGYYGLGCSKTCSSNCKRFGKVCHHIDGNCTSGCKDGYQGEMCDTECDTGKYGDGCLKACSRNCKGRYDACHHITGRCTNGCDDGYEGEKCDIECSAGRYGARCSSYCSTNCAGSDRACDHVNGTCDEGCKTGYIGAKCDQECETGQFGEGCKKTCSDHCAGDKNPCHHMNGTCDMGCEPGYHGSLCIKTCNMRKFGAVCNETCSDHYMNRKCHHKTGQCEGCVESRTGNFCETAQGFCKSKHNSVFETSNFNFPMI